MRHLRIKNANLGFFVTAKEIIVYTAIYIAVGMILGFFLALLTSCSGEAFTSGFRSSEVVADSGSALFGDKDRVVVRAPSVSPFDSGLNDATDSPFVTLLEAATDSRIEETTPIPDAASKPILGSEDASIPDSGSPQLPPHQCISSECRTGTYGERGCCRPDGSCGVIFSGQSHDCIAFR